MIMSDDLGYECIGVKFSGTSYATPRLDEMAANGMRFDEGHVLPLCTRMHLQICVAEKIRPELRVALMTGKHNFRNYIGFGLLPPDEVGFGHQTSSCHVRSRVCGLQHAHLWRGKWQLYSGTTRRGGVWASVLRSRMLISGKWQLYSYNPPDVMPEMRNKGQKIEDAGSMSSVFGTLITPSTRGRVTRTRLSIRTARIGMTLKASMAMICSATTSSTSSIGRRTTTTRSSCTGRWR